MCHCRRLNELRRAKNLGAAIGGSWGQPHVTVPLSKGKVSLLDWADVGLAERKWSTSSNGYAVAGGTGKKGRPYPFLYLHREVARRVFGDQAIDGLEVDHINNDRTDNRRSNLRPATRWQNSVNTPGQTQHRVVAEYKGVYPAGTGKSGWVISIKRPGKPRHTEGPFPTPELAARAYDRAARRIHGEFAYLNFPEEPDAESLVHLQSMCMEGL